MYPGRKGYNSKDFLPEFSGHLQGACYFYVRNEVIRVARGKYEYWLSPDGLIKLEGWARDGLTDNQISEKIGINRDTLYRWKREYPVFSDSLKKGKEVVDIQVENALLKRALGYKYTEVTREPCYNKDTGQMELVVTKKVDKEVLPDTTAQIFWLKNRRPDKWRDKQIYENTDALDKLDSILAEVKADATK